jgi:hypothetical protein
MARSRIALALLLASFIALYAIVVPASANGPTSPAAYFPTALGTEWAYRVTDQRRGGRLQVHERIEVVTAVTEKDGTHFITLTERGDYNPRSVRECSVSEAGIRSRSVSHGTAGDWHTIFPSSVASGQVWENTGTNPNTRTVANVTGWETVRVPAGVYQALRVDIVHTVEPPLGTRDPLTGAMWYAPGVGLVKMVITRQTSTFRVVQELTAFKPGRE